MEATPTVENNILPTAAEILAMRQVFYETAAEPQTEPPTEPPTRERHLTIGEIRQIANLIDVEFSPEEIDEGKCIADDLLSAIVDSILADRELYCFTGCWMALPERKFEEAAISYLIAHEDDESLAMLSPYMLRDVTAWPLAIIECMQANGDYEILGDCLSYPQKCELARAIIRTGAEAELFARYDGVRRVLHFNDTVGAYYFYRMY